MTIERDPYITIVSMNRASAVEFWGGPAFKVVCTGQADPKRHRFGARVYRIFPTQADWLDYRKKAASP